MQEGRNSSVVQEGRNSSVMEKGRNSSVVQGSNEEDDGCVVLEGVDSSEE